MKYLAILLIAILVFFNSCNNPNEQAKPATAQDAVQDAQGKELLKPTATTRRSDIPFWDYLNLFPIESLPFELTAQSLMQVKIDPIPQKYVDKFICEFNPEIFQYTQCNGKIDNLYPFARLKLPERDYELLWILQDDAASKVPSTKPNFSYICTYSKEGELIDIDFGTFYGEIECTDVRISEFYEIYEHLKSSPESTDYMESVYSLTENGKIENFVAYNEGSMEYYLKNLPNKYKGFLDGEYEFSDPTQYDSITDIPRYFAIKHGLFEARLLPTNESYVLAISNKIPMNWHCAEFENFFLNYNGSEYTEINNVFPDFNFHDFYDEGGASSSTFENSDSFSVSGFDLDLSKVHKSTVNIGICNQNQKVPAFFRNETDTIVLEWSRKAEKFLPK